MSRVGKNAAASIAAIICIAFVANILLPLSGAQSADTAPPVTNASVAGTFNPNTGWYIANASGTSVTLTAKDDSSGVSSTLYNLDGQSGGSYATYTSPIPLSDGSHTLIYYSIDNAGKSELLKSLSVKVDTVSPTMNITIKGNISSSGWYNGTALVNLTASDSTSGVSSISYSFDSVTWMPYTGNISLPDGQYTLYYGSYDRAGNPYNNSTPINVFNPTIIVSPEKQWVQSNASVSLTTNSSNYGIIKRFEYSFDRSTWWPGQTIIVNMDGNHTFYCRAVSTSDVVSDIYPTWIGIDTGNCTISASIDGDKSDKGWYNGDIYVTLNVKGDAVLTEYYWNGHWSNYTGKFKIAKQASGTLEYRTTDAFTRSASGKTFIYFAPGSYNQGSMSNSIYLNGITYGPSTGDQGSSGSDNPVTTPRPTRVPSPMPALIPSPSPESTDTSSGSDSPLAIAVLIGVLAVIAIAAAAYFFIRKPK